ncbi:MAG: ABC transporter ATP-binding protein, partial [Bacteroidota bacterium]
MHFAYGEQTVLRDLQFAVGAGEFVGVIGPNGAGKTTLLRLLTGMRTASRGEVRIGERDVRTIPSRERALMMAVVPQNEAVAFPYTVEAMVLLGRFPHTAFLGYERAEDIRIAHDVMKLVGVDHLAGRSVTDLSGGEQHSVFIARALAQQTPILL